jgi:hypothetical protein
MRNPLTKVAAFVAALLLTIGLIAAPPAAASLGGTTYLGSLVDLTTAQAPAPACNNPPAGAYLSSYHPVSQLFGGVTVVTVNTAQYPLYRPGWWVCPVTGYWAGGNVACSNQGCNAGVASLWQGNGSSHWFICWVDGTDGLQWDQLSLKDTAGHYLVGWFPDGWVNQNTRYYTHC